MASPPQTLTFTNGNKELTFDSPGFQTKEDLETIGYSGSPYILIEDEREWSNLVKLDEEIRRWDQDFENEWSLLNDPRKADELYHTNDQWVRDPRMVRMFKCCLWQNKSYQDSDSRDPLVSEKLREYKATDFKAYNYKELEEWKKKAKVGDEYPSDPLALRGHPKSCFWPPEREWKTIKMASI